MVSSLSGVEYERVGDKDEEAEVKQQRDTLSKNVMTKCSVNKGLLAVVLAMCGMCLVVRPFLADTTTTMLTEPSNNKYVKPGIVGSLCYEVDNHYKKENYGVDPDTYPFELSNCTCEDNLITQVDMEHVAWWDDLSDFFGTPDAITESDIEGPVFCVVNWTDNRRVAF